MDTSFKMVIAGLLFLIFQVSLKADKPEKFSTNLDFTYLKKADDSKLLKVNLYIMVNRKAVPVIGVPVNITLNADTKNIIVNTNKEGIAYLVIDKNTKLNEVNGTINFQAAFNGNDTLESIVQEISLKDATILLTFDQVDSLRTVNAKFIEIYGADTLPVAGQTVSFYVPRMLSFLKIAEETTDESGNISFEFPIDLPGQKNGMITVVARIEENETYANIEVMKAIKWGVPIINPVPESHRALWTQVAPVWMIITLSIMLVGVWSHYIFTIIQLFLIRKEGKNIQA